MPSAVNAIALVAIVATACGRVGFDLVGEASGVPLDGPVPACVSGTPITPVAVLNASKSAPADACGFDNLLALDGAVAGLDRTNSSLCSSTWDPQGSCGCIAVDLGRVQPVEGLSVWAAPIGQACGTPCTSKCGMGHALAVLVGTQLDDYTLIADLSIGDSPTIIEHPVAVMRDVRYAVMCRQAWGEENDDVVIDQVVITCR